MEWYKDNIQDPSGKYYVGDKPRPDGKTTADHLNGLVNNPRALSQPTGITQEVQPQNWSNRTNTMGWTSANRGQFNPLRNDKVFGEATLNLIAQDFKNGKIHPLLEQTANTLGMSPLALMNQQMGAYGLEPLDLAPVRGAVPQRNQTGSNQTNGMNSVQGANYLMTNHNLPSRGAAWLSGNIQQESGWIANRPAWNDVGAPAGGLVSWRGGRLTAMQDSVGVPITQQTQAQQLDYMMQEMKTKYPEAYRIFMNPNATDKQLIRASKIYWGYGEEGKRFIYAGNIEKQLNTKGSVTSQQAGIPPTSVPYIDQTQAKNGEGGRQCFSAVATMLANAYGINISYDAYNDLRGRYGDTTTSSAQTQALGQLGLNASVSDNGSMAELAQLVQSGKPVAIGIQHNSGSGHWILVTGVDANGNFRVHDPFGRLVQRRGGGWAYTNRGQANSGKDVIYNRDFLASVWVDRGAGTGRIMRIG